MLKLYDEETVKSKVERFAGKKMLDFSGAARS
jgi:hypothetical protein